MYLYVFTDYKKKQDDMRPLHYACKEGHTAIVKELLDQGVYINAMDKVLF